MKNDKSYLLGIIGAILGGLLFSVPWILLYVYANFIFSICATLVAIGSLKGYTLFKGKIDKPLPIIIAIVSILSISFATLFIIPMLIIIKNGGSPTINNLIILYSNSEFSAAIIKDYVISIIFTILGISGTIVNIKNQIKEDKDKIETPKIINNGIANNAVLMYKKDFDLVRNIFRKYNAYNSTNKISEDTLKQELGKDFKKVKWLVNSNVVIKENDSYYYDVNKGDEFYNKLNNKANPKQGIIIIILSIIFGICIAIAIVMSVFSGSKNNTKTTNSINNKNEYSQNLPYMITKKLSNYKEYYDEKEANKFYYVPLKDLSYESGYIVVVYDNTISYSDYNSLKKELLDNLNNNLLKSGENTDNKVELYDDYESIIGNKVLCYKYDNDDYSIYIYYAIRGNKFIYIAAQDYKIDGIDNKGTAKTIAEFYPF